MSEPSPSADHGSGPRFVEFVALMATLMSLVALSIDAMLPALGEMGSDLGTTHPNDVQLVVSLVFLGMAAGQLVYGPLSDSFGRRPAMLAGLALYMLGCVVSLLSRSFSVMLAGRLILACLLAVFVCQGTLYGNLTALAMEPLGRIAGVGAAVVGARRARPTR